MWRGRRERDADKTVVVAVVVVPQLSATTPQQWLQGLPWEFRLRLVATCSKGLGHAHVPLLVTGRAYVTTVVW